MKHIIENVGHSAVPQPVGWPAWYLWTKILRPQAEVWRSTAGFVFWQTLVDITDTTVVPRYYGHDSCI